jgi:hypothetical protein
MKNKFCNQCKETKSVSEFRPNKTKHDGLQFYCRECDKKKQAEHYRKNKERYIAKAHSAGEANVKWFQEYKKTLKCNRCTENHPACLQFHHIDPSKKEVAVSQVVRRWGRKRILAEIAKCEIICANCHFKEHYEE